MPSCDAMSKRDLERARRWLLREDWTLRRRLAVEKQRAACERLIQRRARA